MRYFIHTLVLLLAIYASDAYSQAKVKCDLVELAYGALTKNPTIVRSSYAVGSAESDLRIQRSAFDLNSFSELSLRNDRYRLLGADPRTSYIENSLLKTNVLNLSAGVRKKIRTGQTMAFDMNYGFTNNNYPFNAFNQPIVNYLGNNASTLNVSLIQPLLRGKGRAIATALEQTYTLYVANAKSNNEFTNSYELWQIGNAYWNYYTAFKSLEIYRENESRIRNVLAVTQELVKGDKKPAGDLVQIRADLASQERQTLMAEQDLYAARIYLGKVIGLSSEESVLLDSPENAFPTIAGSDYRRDLDKADFLSVAREQRADLRAARQGHEALDRQYQLAENNTKPQLDLTGFVSYGSVSTGNGMSDVLSSFSSNYGRNIGTGARLTFTFPVNNNLARGNLAKSYFALSDQSVVMNNLQRSIELDISNDVNYLHNSVSTLEKAEEVLKYNRDVFNDEQVKFKSGLTTLLSLILFQDRLTAAQLRYLQAHRQFAGAIINLRHDTGTLIRPENKGFTIDQSAFYTIPVSNKN
jgi:outer membrane protein